MKIKLVRENAALPKQATDGSAGYDLCACICEPVDILPGRTEKFPTGVAVQITPGYAGFVFARSGLGIKHGIVPANAVGVIDSDYRGEIMVGLHNQSEVAFTIQPGERIAQLVFLPVYTPELEESEDLEDTVRGAGGFGSTGK